jgi:cell division protein FtsB
MINTIKNNTKNIWIYAIVLLLIYFSYLHYKTAVDFNALKLDEKIFNEKIAYERDKSATLDKIEEKASSKKTIESMARSNLNYLKDGEILFVDGEKK